MNKNKAIIQFLLRFFGVYIVLTALYSWYLKSNQQTDVIFSCAPITKTVANQSKTIVELFGYDVELSQSFGELSVLFAINQHTVAKIVEGCTAVSVMILFLAFIIAFKGRLKQTVIFGVIGLLAIYFANIFRIAVLAIGIYHYPEYTDFLHGVVFPGIIYGMVFLLWVIWVKNYAIKSQKK